jgi:hypothetical protein
MPYAEATRQRFDQVLRLRRAERATPGNRDLISVRAELEDELGATVSPNMAARILGVSHTALANWIRAGDIPVVPTPSGRQGVPVPALIDLYESVARERATGRRRLHVLEPHMVEQRQRAEQLDAGALVEPGGPDEDPHRRAQRRALAYHRAVARRLRKPMVDDALHQLWKWRDAGHIDPHYAEQWESVLRSPVREVARIISEDSRLADDLRQNSPFAGTLSEPERRRILRDVQ